MVSSVSLWILKSSRTSSLCSNSLALFRNSRGWGTTGFRTRKFSRSLTSSPVIHRNNPGFADVRRVGLCPMDRYAPLALNVGAFDAGWSQIKALHFFFYDSRSLCRHVVFLPCELFFLCTACNSWTRSSDLVSRLFNYLNARRANHD